MKAMIYNSTKSFSLSQTYWRYALHVSLGSIFLALLAQVEIPLQPVPVTLHTFAIFLLALFQGSNKAALSTLLYLGEATLGLPVFPNVYSNPLWILHPTAGYCLSFPIAAYLIGKIVELQKNPSAIRMAFSILCGQLVIYLIGVSWLSYFVDWNQALTFGLYPFIPMAVLKLCAAVSLKKGGSHVSSILKQHCSFFF